MKSKKPYFTIIKSDLGREAVLAEDYADLIERHALLQKHAEAMHEELMKTDRYFPVGFAYRTDFQKE